MNRLALLLGSVALLAAFGQACSSSSDDAARDDDDDDTTSSGGINRDASTTRPGSSSGGNASSGGSGSSSSSGSGTSSSSGGADAGNRCDRAADRTEARYTECGVGFLVLDAGSPAECTDTRADEAERIAQCVENASCGGLRADADASADSAAYAACVNGVD